jgi:hypothetical protein
MRIQTIERLYTDGVPLHQLRARHSYYAEVPAMALDERSQLVDQVIRFAFETLGVRHLDVRVSGADIGSLAAHSSAHGRGSAR